MAWLPLAASAAAALRPGVGRAWQRRGLYEDRPEIPSLPEIAERAGVQDPPWTAPRWMWKYAWRYGNRALPLLHRWDDCAPTNTNVNLMVCWLKAIGANHWRGLDDGGLGYDLLPPVTRRIVAKPFASLYPLLHHQNVLLRSAFLDIHVEAELRRTGCGGSTGSGGSTVSDVVVVLGAGFDLRSLRLKSPEARAAQWVEVDLPHVIDQRKRLLARLARRRSPLETRIASLTQLAANLSVASEVRAVLRTGLRASPARGHAGVASGGHAIFVVEALMIYLAPEVAAAMLRACVEEARAAGASHATLCFADRLPHVSGCCREEARGVLRTAGFVSDDAAWLPKPGLARHMGVARATL